MEGLKVVFFLYLKVIAFRNFIFSVSYMFNVSTVDKSNEDEELPSMDALEINERDTIQHSPRCAGGEEEEEEDIPDMEDFDEIDNDPVSWLYYPH